MEKAGVGGEATWGFGWVLVVGWALSALILDIFWLDLDDFLFRLIDQGFEFRHRHAAPASRAGMFILLSGQDQGKWQKPTSARVVSYLICLPWPN